jgi:acyl-CoA dehydrogenase
MRRNIYDRDHELFRDQVKRFLDREVVPRIPQWNETGVCDRETWRRLGAQGFLAPSAPVEYGGAGVDFLYDAIVIEELAYVRAHALMVSLHCGVGLPYVATFGIFEQKRRYLPRIVSGEILLGICMSEPSAGSDLQNIGTTAVVDGDDYVLNGSKTFISHGQLGDLFIVAAKTDPKSARRAPGSASPWSKRRRPDSAVGASSRRLGCGAKTRARSSSRTAPFGEQTCSGQKRDSASRCSWRSSSRNGL